MIVFVIVLIPSAWKLDKPFGGVIVAGKIVANNESLISHMDGSWLVLLQVVTRSLMVEVAVSIPFPVRLIMGGGQGRK